MFLEKHPMDVKILADKGDVFTSDKDKNILLGIDILNVIKTDTKTISIENSIEYLISELSTSHQKLFAVVDEKQQLLGLIDFELVKPILFNPVANDFKRTVIPTNANKIHSLFL